MSIHLHFYIEPSESGTPMLGKSLAEPKTKEMLAEGLVDHISGALRTATLGSPFVECDRADSILSAYLRYGKLASALLAISTI